MQMINDTVGGVVHSTLEQLSSITDEELGHCALFEDKTIGDDRYCILTGCPKAKRVTLVLRGSSDEVLQEVSLLVYVEIANMIRPIEVFTMRYQFW